MPELHDDVLERELRRRASGEWQPDRVLPAVRRGMDMQPERVSSAPRWAALAGLVGVLAAVVVLAVALPRLPAGPSAASPTPDGQLTVLSTADFAARLDSGELNGRSVLVEGRIESGLPVSRQACLPTALCFFGHLSVGGQVVVVENRYVATLGSGEATAISADGIDWSWWYRPQAPVEGVLVLAVDQSRTVEYIGRAGDSADLKRHPVDQLLQVGLDGIDLDEVLIVDAWLHARGSKFVPACASPAPAERVCAEEESWLASGGEFDEATALQVQPSAYSDFSRAPDDGDADAGPRRGLYALAKRLAFTGCDSDVPCWSWQIVARIADVRPAVTPPPPLPEASDPVLTESPIPTPSSPASPVPTPLVEGGEPLPARWDIAPSARPDPASTSIEVQVWELQCASGQSPEGRILPPAIEYSARAVSITFSVRRLPGDQECIGSPPATYVVELEEPLGNRRLLDGWNREQIERLRFVDGLLVLGAEQAASMAHERLAAALGPDGCPQTVNHDREDSPEDWERWAGEVQGTEGMSARGNVWLGEPLDAARAFGAFEVYQGADGWYFMAVAAGQPWLGIGEEGVLGADIAPGSLIVADLYRADLADGRTLWLPGYSQHSAGTIGCMEPGPGDAGVTDTATLGDFELTISAGSDEYAEGEPIDVYGTLSYEGPGGDSITLVGSGSGLVIFSVDQLNGQLSMGGVVTADCKPYELTGGQPLVLPYAKGAGWSSDDPNADFYRNWVQDPEFTLPAGVWRVSAHVNFYIGECGGDEVALEASIVITVR